MGKSAQSRQALYRAYRGRSFEEVIGQDHITKPLAAAIKTGRIAHAYLLTGPRGVGKTSVARIIAHEINGLTYDDDRQHLDIIEIDAASNRGIDEIRDLREKVQLAPVSSPYKVYIIDEVHMLTTQAFNALLKTLEEPPRHAVFILATTEAHKIPETIVSRTQRFSFRPITPEAVTAQLQLIAKKEHIDIDNDALLLLAAYGSGSMRDSLSMFDQLSGQATRITASDVEHMLGLAPMHIATNVLIAIESGDFETLDRIMKEIHTAGIEAGPLVRQLVHAVRVSGMTAQRISLIDDLLQVHSSYDPMLKLEIALYKQLQNKTPASPSSLTPQPQTPVPIKPIQKQSASLKEPSEAPRIQKTPTTTAPASPADLGAQTKEWSDVLDRMKAHNNAIYAVLRMAQPVIGESTATLGFQFPFHEQRILEAKNRAALQEALDVVFGPGMELLTHSNPETISSTEAASGDNMKSVIQLMGGGSPVELDDV